MIPSAARCYWQLNDPYCSDAAATAAAKIANVFEWPGQPQEFSKVAFGGFAPHLIHVSVGPPESS